jgi:hypothetical protein
LTSPLPNNVINWLLVALCVLVLLAMAMAVFN